MKKNEQAMEGGKKGEKKGTEQMYKKHVYGYVRPRKTDMEFILAANDCSLRRMSLQLIK